MSKQKPIEFIIETSNPYKSSREKEEFSSYTVRGTLKLSKYEIPKDLDAAVGMLQQAKAFLVSEGYNSVEFCVSHDTSYYDSVEAYAMFEGKRKINDKEIVIMEREAAHRRQYKVALFNQLKEELEA